MTVVIPVWDDYVRVVGDAVNSVLVQEPAAEVLVVNNASSEPLPTFPAGVSTVRLRARGSVGAARNIGLSLVRTEFVLFLDADDLLAEGTLLLLLSRLKEHQRLAASCCGVVAWNASTGDVRRLDFPSRRTNLIARWPSGYRIYAAMGNRMPTTGCVLMRTAMARDAGGFTDCDFGEDWALNVALAFRGPIEFLSRPGRLLRVHGKSLRARPRTRAEVANAYGLMRARLKADPACPPVVRLGCPLLALYHAWQVKRITPGGTSRPGRALEALGDGGLVTIASAKDQPAKAGR
jgi:glycosyltransferase involved in cell wall biosynthesis